MLTFRGRTTAVFVFALGIAGFGFRYGELIALALGAFVALTLGWLWVRGHNAISVTRMLESTELEAGQDIASVIAVTNTSTKMFNGGVLYETLKQTNTADRGIGNQQPAISTGPHKNGTEHRNPTDSGRARSIPVRVGRIDSKGQIVTSYALPKSIRGEYQLGPLRFEQADVFGLWRKTRQFDVVETILVRPKVHNLLGDATGRHQQAPSRTANPALSSSIAFDRLRAYVVGDDLRRVHWKTSARAGELMVRETLDEIVDDILIVIDDNTGDVDETQADTLSNPEKRLGPNQAYEDLVEIAASLAMYAAQVGQRARIRTSSGATAEQNAGVVSTEALRLLALASPTSVGIDNEAAGLKTLRPGGKQFLLTTRGGRSNTAEFVRQTASMMGRRSPKTHLIEIGPLADARTSPGPVSAGPYIRWCCSNAQAFVEMWPDMERQ
jgi:uncharacterized protein (DUF58 family)